MEIPKKKHLPTIKNTSQQTVTIMFDGIYDMKHHDLHIGTAEYERIYI